MELRKKPSIALVGASRSPEKFGNRILKDLRSKGFEIVPVNPNAASVDGLPAYADLKNVIAAGIPVDLIVYVTPPDSTLHSLQEAHDLKLHKVWIQPGAGNESVREYLEQENFAFLMDACVMVES